MSKSPIRECDQIASSCTCHITSLVLRVLNQQSLGFTPQVTGTNRYQLSCDFDPSFVRINRIYVQLSFRPTGCCGSDLESCISPPDLLSCSPHPTSFAFELPLMSDAELKSDVRVPRDHLRDFGLLAGRPLMARPTSPSSRRLLSESQSELQSSLL